MRVSPADHQLRLLHDGVRHKLARHRDDADGERHRCKLAAALRVVLIAGYWHPVGEPRRCRRSRRCP